MSAGQGYKSILVVHPAAIGDAVMGLSVPLTLRRVFPEARIVYLTHASLFPLLELSGAVTVFLEWSRATSVWQLADQARSHAPDLVVDLVGSLKTRLLSLLLRKPAFTYGKQRDRQRWDHVVDNYLSTLKPLGIDKGQLRAPMLLPPPELVEELTQDERLGQPLIAIVPGVGKLRPNRAWPAGNWEELGARLHSQLGRHLVLVGGPDDAEVCSLVARALGPRCTNVAGKMSLVQTAALLSRCEFVISADTGPAHIAAAVGRRVVCLMGPTDAARTGPYAMEQIGISRNKQCHCRQAKRCLVNDGKGSGECMKTISVDEVMTMVLSAVPPAPDAVPVGGDGGG